MAHDDAVLDMIALEMGATDFDEPATERDWHWRGRKLSTRASCPSLSRTALIRVLIPSPNSAPEIAASPSLGVSLLASGIVGRATTRSDPLAPIRRMT